MRKVRHDCDGISATPEILRHGGLRHLDAELLQLSVDPWSPPQWVRLPHLANQCTEVRGQRRPADATAARIPAPIGGERAPMPTHHGGRGYDLHRLPPVWPDARKQHPEQPIDRTQARTFQSRPLEHSELMPERENFGRELEPRTGRRLQRGQHGDEQRSHPARERYQFLAATAAATTRTEYSVGTPEHQGDPWRDGEQTHL